MINLFDGVEKMLVCVMAYFFEVHEMKMNYRVSMLSDICCGYDVCGVT